MKKVIIICILFVSFILNGQESRIAIQAAHSDFVTKTVIDAPRNLLISYGSFSDKTLKFWDLSSGILLKTIDIPEHARDFTVDFKTGKTYVAIKQAFIVYDNTTLTEIKRVATNVEIQNVAFRNIDNKVYFLSGDFDDIALNTFDPLTGKMALTGGQTFPNPQAGDMEFVGKDAYLWVKSYTRSHVVFQFETKKYIILEDAPRGFFEDVDQIYTYLMDPTHLKVVRYGATANKILWEKVLVIEEEINNNKLQPKSRGSIAISQENNSVWVAHLKTPLIELDAFTGDVKGVIYNNLFKNELIADKDYVYVFENERLFAQGSCNKYRRYSEKPVATFGFDVLNPQNIVFNTDASAVSLFTSDINGKIYSLFTNNATTQITNYDPKFDATNTYARYGDLSITKNGETGYYVTSNAKEGIKQFTPGDKNSFKKLTASYNTSTNSIAFSPNIKLLGYLENNSFQILQVDTNKNIASIPVKNVRKIDQAFLSFSPNGKSLAAGISDEIVFDANYKKRLDYYNLTNGMLQWSKPDNYREFFFIESGKQLLAINIDAKKADVLNTENGELIRSFSMPEANYSLQFAINPSGNKLLLSDKNVGVKVYDVVTGKLISENKNFKELYNTYVAFVTDAIYAQVSDGAIKFFDINSDKELLRLFIFIDGEWIAHTPEGLFDGSQNAWNRVAFVRGRQTIPLDQVFNKFYTPRLLYSFLKGDKIEKPIINIDAIKNPPTVSISYSEGTRNLTVEDAISVIETENSLAKITVDAQAKGDKISEIRLFHNDKLVSNTTRNLTVEDDITSEEKKVYNVTLLEGENYFKAIAINSENTESAPQEITVKYAPKKEDIIKPSGIQLHLVVVGIDVYKNPKYNLNYAVADASGFKDAVGVGMKSITSNINSYYIKNNEAIKEKIIQTFKDISSKANAQDVFIFYYAGHGMMSDASKTFYLVPHDVTQIYGADESIKAKGISAETLKELSAAIPAQKQLYILDACQSGGALSAISARGAAEEKAIAQLARSTGTHWLTASGSEQFATEFDELGHGVFTYVLLQALSGKADSGDGKITVNEIKAYIESEVPEVSGKYRGAPQYPSSFGFGQDFPVGVKK